MQLLLSQVNEYITHVSCAEYLIVLSRCGDNQGEELGYNRVIHDGSNFVLVLLS